MNPPLISVVIAVRNGETFLPDAVASIRAQAYAPLEVFVVDDGSTDRTAEVARSLGGEVRVLVQPPRGPAAARNLALRQAQGELLAFLDADDLWTPGSLVARLEYLDAHPEVDIVFGLTQRVAMGDEETPLAPAWAALAFGSALFRRRVWTRIGLLDESLTMSEDVDWCLRAREVGTAIRFLPRVTLLYRIHSNNVTNDIQVRDQGFLRALQLSVARRRADPARDLAPLPDLDEWRARGLPGA